MSTLFRRGGLLLAAGLMLGPLAACDSVDRLLEVENPEAIPERSINDPALVSVLVNSVVGQFQNAYDTPFLWIGALPTDETLTGINWEDYARVNQRIILYNEGPADAMFSELSEARVMADTVASLLQELVENPGSDARVALAQVYSGYSHILLGDAMCEATINVGATKFQPVELYQFAADKLERGLATAEAAGDEDLITLAHAGLARAHLNLGNSAEVMRHAAEVSADYRHWVEFSDLNPDVYNVLFSRRTGTNHSIGVHPDFFIYGEFRDEPVVNQTDPRIQHTPEWTTGHNALTPLYKPFQPLLFSEFSGNTIAEICAGVAPEECDEKFLLGTGQIDMFNRGTDVALASDIEAMHNYYEAAGPDGVGPLGTTLEFVNARRAFGNQAPVSLSGTALMAELREQRGRDLYMAGFRLGDLRRWLRQGVGNLFPEGAHPVDQWGAYGEGTCFPLPREEEVGNPNL